MSEPKYMQEYRQNAVSLGDEELVFKISALGNGDDYDGCFTTRGLNELKAYEQEAMNRYKTLRARLSELEEANRWIPVGERLPNPPENTQETVVAIDMNDIDPYPFVAGYTHQCGFDALTATHWRPLPPPPESEEE